MRLVRTILALAIAASLALLPVGATAAGVGMASGNGQAGMHHMDASTDMSMDDCCPDGMKRAPSHTDGYKCNMGLCCVGGMAALADIRAAGAEFLPAAGSKLAIPADQIVSFRGGSPPFRPPRV